MRKLILFFAFLFSLSTFAQDIGRPSSYNYQRALEAVSSADIEQAIEYFNKEIADNPRNGYAHSWIAAIYNNQEQYGPALSAANQALKHLPRKDKEYLSNTYQVRAKIYLALEDTLKALSDYAAAAKATPDDQDIYEDRAQIYYEQQKYTLSDADYRTLIDLDQGGVLGYMGLGRNLKVQNHFSDAIDQFSTVIKLHPDYSSAYSFRAECYLALEDWNHATDDLVTALKIDSDDKAFYHMQDLSDAPFSILKSKFQIRATAEPNEDRWPYYNGVIHERRHLYAQAITYFQQACTINLDAAILERIANCYQELEQFQNALQTLNRALNMQPGKSSLLIAKADVLHSLDRNPEAIAIYDTLIANNPYYDYGYYTRGWLKSKSDNIPGAIDDYSLAITLDPSYTPYYYYRAEAYARQNQSTLATADYQRNISLEEDSRVYRTAHYSYQSLGQDDKAIAIIDTILAHDTNSASNYYDAACLFSRMNRPSNALHYLEIAFQKGFSHFHHISIDNDMDNLRPLPAFKTLIAKYQPAAIATISDGSDTTTPQPEIVEIPFTREPGSSICNVKCTINNLPLYFIFDSGASDVSISQVEATFMLKNGFLSKSDIIGSTYYMDAVGNVNVGTVINIKDVNFGGLQLSNIRASVVQNQRAPLLLGQSVLGRLGKIEIDNSNNILRISK